MINNFQFQLVVYDESEQFREHTDKLFAYPYQARKQIMGKQQLNLQQAGHEAFTVSFSITDVCLEGNWSDQITNIFGNSWKSLKSMIGV